MQTQIQKQIPKIKEKQKEKNFKFLSINKNHFSNKNKFINNEYENDEIKNNTEEIVQFDKKYSALFKLNNRCIISVSGKDSTLFLQSLITNDMKIFEKEEEINRASIFALFLNPKGRILFDSILIKSQL
jgi:glycine cleavage system aminomethyltransferase T